MKSLLKKVISNFHKKRILVLGDLMMDHWVWGKVNRISPEAPVPIVEVDNYSYTPGGAANVVNNLCSLGAKVSLIGVVGKDFIGKKLKRDLKFQGVDVKGIFYASDRPTTLKTRIIAHSQQVVRADYEKKERLSKEIIKTLIHHIAGDLKNYDALLISDYNKGVINADLLGEVLNLSRQYALKVIAGPKPENLKYFTGINLITLNQKEASLAVGFELKKEKDLIQAGEKILKDLNLESILITRGESGMSLFERGGKIYHVPALASEVYDVSGAGDTAISVLTLALTCGASFYQATLLSNQAAAIVVKKVGTAVVTALELEEVLK
ncbi:MAG: D-glycero-beta-D-manno-heptose-7-phosphate kinase [Armatimonadetes bacterium]|nr:D-glycero-beta-D-manno-heptose-7-phosphate kinase [Armatimonadota bacterium]